MTAAIVGGGVIGGGWAARFLLNGWDVTLCDPDPEAARKVEEVLANARRALPGLYDAALPPEGNIRVVADLRAAVADADWVQESVPERLDLKHAVLAEICAHAPGEAIVASSTSGFKPSQLNEKGGRAVVAHPFNPVYLLPLVELCGEHGTCARAAETLRGLGMFPLTLRKEIDAHVADRLLEAVWRESLWLVKDDVATTEEIDDAIRMGFGLRWGQMGLFETYRIAGGEAGMRHFLAQFGPALKWPWTRLMDVPELDDALVEKIAGQSDAQSGDLDVRDLERKRDDNLVAMLRALKRRGAAAGGVIAEHEARLAAAAVEATGPDGLPCTMRQRVPTSWLDYNGHMNETHYLEIASRASDRLMEMVGADAAYIAGGKSYFTVENHLRYHSEVHAGEELCVTSQVLDATGKRLHAMQRIYAGDGAGERRLAATMETLLIHVDLTARRSCPPEGAVAQRAQALAEAHSTFPRPETVFAR